MKDDDRSTEEWTQRDHDCHQDATLKREEEDRQVQEEVNRKAQQAYRQADADRQADTTR